MLKNLRILVLLFVLAFVALGAWRAKTRSVEWAHMLPVNIFLVNGDGSPVAAEYLRTLTVEDFKPIATFMRAEAVRYGRGERASIEVQLAGRLDALPPEPPRNGGMLEIGLWSLQMRWWAYRHADVSGPGPQVKMFLLYFDPAQHSTLEHSTGMQKGLLGRVNVFASRDMARQNNVVIAHEFLHTLGATDKYDPATLQPLYPDGYAEPELQPRLPQRFAEIMAGRMPISQSEAATPASLDEALIGSKTAQEINWQ